MCEVVKTRAQMRVSVKGASKRAGVKKPTTTVKSKKPVDGENIGDNRPTHIFISYNSDDDKIYLLL